MRRGHAQEHVEAETKGEGREERGERSTLVPTLCVGTHCFDALRRVFDVQALRLIRKLQIANCKLQIGDLRH